VVPVGGGGLIAGAAQSLAGRGVSVVGVQPEANCAMHESLALGRALTRYEGRPTLAEGCEGPVAESTYRICAALGVTTVLVSEAAIARAVAHAYRLGFVVETSAAVAIAGVLEGVVPAEAGTVVVVSGGNIDADKLDSLIAAERLTSSLAR
jgi:threonine dehydratase